MVEEHAVRHSFPVSIPWFQPDRPLPIIFAYRRMWFFNSRYIGDAKHGRLVGTDSLGNKYFENTDPTQEVPGQFGMDMHLRDRD